MVGVLEEGNSPPYRTPFGCSGGLLPRKLPNGAGPIVGEPLATRALA